MAISNRGRVKPGGKKDQRLKGRSGPRKNKKRSSKR